MWRTLTGSWSPVGCWKGPQPWTQSLQTLLFGCLWFPGTPTLVVGIPPPTAGNLPDTISTVPENKGRRSGSLNVTMGKDKEKRNRELDGTREKGVQREYLDK